MKVWLTGIFVTESQATEVQFVAATNTEGEEDTRGGGWRGGIGEGWRDEVGREGEKWVCDRRGERGKDKNRNETREQLDAKGQTERSERKGKERWGERVKERKRRERGKGSEEGEGLQRKNGEYTQDQWRKGRRGGVRGE